MKLIFIHDIGEDFDGKNIYEFIFAKSVEGVDGEGWDTYPASGNPEPPEKGYIDKVGRVELDELKFTCIQNSDTFAVWDAVDGIVALAWEDITEGYEDYPEDRIKFFFGDELSDVSDLLYSRDIIIEWKYDSKNELQKKDNQDT
jgi:hypothetical protein